MKLSIRWFFMRELKAFVQNKAYVGLLVIIPPILFLLYGYIYEERAIHNLPIAVWDEDQSSLSRTLLRFIESSEGVKIYGHVISKEEVEEGMQKGDFYGCIHIPKRFEDDVKRKHVPLVGLYINTSNLVIGKLLYKYNAEILLTTISGISLEKFKLKGMPDEEAMALVQPFHLDMRNGYNATYNYQMYLVPGLSTVSLQMILIMAACLAFNRERRKHFATIGKLKFGLRNYFFGKLAAFYWIGMAWCFAFLYLLGSFMGINGTGSFWDYFILFSFFVLACIGVGFLLSAALSSKMLASDFALFYTSPAFVFSGFTFPIWAMPVYDQFYAKLLPYTPFLDGFLKSYFMGLKVTYYMPAILSLLAFIGIAFPLAYWILNQKIRKANV